MSNTLIVREFNAETDFATVQKLEKNCALGSKDVSIFCDMMGDPLCRIKFYLVHVMLVAEMPELRELVGVVRGCIKEVVSSLGRSQLKMGYILGLRVSPRHRRMGIARNLVKAIEEWFARHGAEYVYLAIEENNAASKNLFTLKCNYKLLSLLHIYALPIENPVKKLDWNIHTEKLQINQAVYFYKNQLKSKDFYPVDIETILRGNPSIGTWVCYFNDDFQGLNVKGQDVETIITSKSSSWIVFSLWNSQEVYKLQLQRSCQLHFFLDKALRYARECISPCISLPFVCASPSTKPFGYLFMYGVFGEGKKLKELMQVVWNFAATLAKDVNCKLVVTEVGDSDPLKKHLPLGSSMLCIKDLWYFKSIEKLGRSNEDNKMAFSATSTLGDMFVDPREF